MNNYSEGDLLLNRRERPIICEKTVVQVSKDMEDRKCKSNYELCYQLQYQLELILKNKYYQ